MNSTTELQPTPWPIWQKITFRFFFIYLMLMTAPWSWLDIVPGVAYITEYPSLLLDWCTEMANTHIFHIKDVLIKPYGSGDTSYAWAFLSFCLLLSLVGCLIWSVLDRKRTQYKKMNYWLKNILRYFLAMISFSYGFHKVFALQMQFPHLSQLATPLGDFLPMRFSWMFIGYSSPYQIVSGVSEVLVGLLLLNRRTVTLGLIIGFFMYANVFVLNMCYDIPVKINSSHLVIYCFILLLMDYKRLVNLFILNRSAEADTGYNINFPKRWQRISRIIGKVVFIILFAVIPLYDSWDMYSTISVKAPEGPISGIYNVKTFRKNKDTIPQLAMDTLCWKEVIFDAEGVGSANSTDTSLFRMRYNRGYFSYETDSASQTIAFKKFPMDSVNTIVFHYDINKNNIKLVGTTGKDSLFIDLEKSNRYFKLAEKQFNWMTEQIK